MKDHRFREQTHRAIVWTHLESNFTKTRKDNALFSFSSETFRETFFTISCAIGVIVVFGVLYDLRRTKFNVRKLFVQDDQYMNEDERAKPLGVRPESIEIERRHCYDVERENRFGKTFQQEQAYIHLDSIFGQVVCTEDPREKEKE